MRLVIVPAYLNPSSEGRFAERELIAIAEKKGQLKGVEIDIDPGYPTEWTAATRDAEFLAHISLGAIRRVKEYSASGKYNAILYSGGLDPGFFAARMVSKIPVAGAQHSAVHVASLIGDRISIMSPLDAGSVLRRQALQNYGFSEKVTSVRSAEHSTAALMEILRKYKKEERVKLPEIQKLVGKITTEFITAIEKENVDTLVLGCPQFQVYEDEIRQKLDEAGYGEVPMITEFSAALEMAKTMVNMRLSQAPRAYPTNALKAKPAFR